MKIAIIFVGFVIFGATINTSENKKTQNNQPQVEQQTNEVNSAKEDTSNEKQVKIEVNTTDSEQNTTTKTENKTATVKNITVPVEYKSALNKATTYANTMHMSKLGVYDQLVSEYGEKFSTAAAQYAIENVKANWNANALVKAKIYQDDMSMSPAAIHDQLVSKYGEKFTQSEATYAIQNLNN